MKKYTILVLLFLTIISCRKNKDVVVVIDNEYPTEKYINTSVKGVVIGNRNLPIEDATVETGGVTLKTDLNGYFYFKDIKVNKEGATIKVSKKNYSTVTKTYYPQLNSTTFLKIVLHPGHGATATNSKDEDKNFSSPIAFIKIPNNNFSKNGESYSGGLLVKPFWTIYYKNDFYEKYIGHPVGYNKYFKLKGLKSYGIVGFNISNRYNDKIELGEGNTAELKLIFEEGVEIPENLPDKIPVWHFDYDKDKWLEKGEAIFDYDNKYYTVEVNESGYWNFAEPFDIDSVEFTLKSENNNILPYIKTEITSSENNYKLDINSNSNGKIFCFLPKESENDIDIYLENKKIEKKISTGISNLSVPVKSKTIKITGNFYDCDENIIENGYFTIQKGANSLFYYIGEGKLDIDIIVEEKEDELFWFATDLDNKLNTGVHSSNVEDVIDLQNVYLCPESFALLRYGDERQLLNLTSYDYNEPPVMALVFENDNYYFDLGFFNFQGINGNYTFNNFGYTIIINKKGDNRIYPLENKEQKIKVLEFKKKGMMRGYIEGWAKHKDGSTVLDSAYLKIDYSIYTE